MVEKKKKVTPYPIGYVVEGVTNLFLDYEFTYPFLCEPGRLNHCSTTIHTSLSQWMRDQNFKFMQSDQA